MLAHLLAFARAHDPGLAALKRATRAAVVMPAAFALGSVVIGQPQVALFASFGSFALLLLVSIPGTTAVMLRGYGGPGSTSTTSTPPSAAWPARPSNWPPRPITGHSPHGYS
jgi:hypothetical protein